MIGSIAVAEQALELKALSKEIESLTRDPGRNGIALVVAWSSVASLALRGISGGIEEAGGLKEAT